MNPLSPTQKGGHHRALRVLSFLLIQHALVIVGPNAYARSRLPGNPEIGSAAQADSRPYLQVAGSPPLRFAAAPRSLSTFPAKVSVTAASQPTANTVTESIANAAPATLGSDLKDPAIEQSVAPTTTVTSKPTLSILPDDTRPATRAEDFLPFFQFPAGGDVTVVVPASAARPPPPGQLPASSATYQQR